MSAAREVIAPAFMAALVETGNYAPAVRAGDFVYVSGQVGRDQTMTAVTSSLEDHVEAVFANLVAVLEAAGCTVADVVELVSYHVDLPDQMPTFQLVKRRYFADPATLPAWTAVGVEQLNSPAFLVEVKAVAYKPRA